MQRRTLLAIGTGIALVWLTRWSEDFALEHLYPPASHGSPVLGSITLSLLIALPFVLPGLCTGWIAQRNGMLLGFLTGLVGALTFSILFMALGLSADHALHQLRPSNALIWFWGEGPALMLTSATAGAAGEMLRSNNRWRGP